MPSLLESVSMFNYQYFWRLKGDKQISSRCGGIVTLLSFVILGSIAVYQLQLIFKMNTISFSTQNQIEMDATYTNISTFQNDTTNKPFMLAFQIEGDHPAQHGEFQFNRSVFELKATYLETIKNSTIGSLSYKNTPINFQRCTQDHFSTLPNIQKIFAYMNMMKWHCLPLNRTFELGGNVLYDEHKMIVVSITCTQSDCVNSQNNYRYLTYVTLNHLVSPQNSSYPFIPYLSPRETTIQAKRYSRSFINLNKNILITDSSLIPLENLKTQISFEENTNFVHSSVYNKYPRALFYITNSGRTITIKRSFLKLLTAMSYVGGLVPSIIAALSAFFMMGKFSKSIYQMHIAKYIFQDKTAATLDYKGFIRQLIYSLLKLVNKKPNWQQAEQREGLSKTTNKLLDIVYLQKRIAFLQKGLSVLLEKHQLKALHLSHTLTKSEADETIQNHRFRNKIFRYMRHKQQNNLQLALNRNILARDMAQNLQKSNKFKNQHHLSGKKLVKVQMQAQDIKSQNKREADSLTRNLGQVHRMISSKNQQPPLIPSLQRLNLFTGRLKNDQIKDSQANGLFEMLSDDENMEEDPPQILELQQLKQLYNEARKFKDRRSAKIFKMLDLRMQRFIESIF